MTRMTPDKAGRTIIQADQKIAQLRDVISEANLAIAEIKFVLKEMDRIRSDIDKRFGEAFDDKVESQVANKLAEYNETVGKAIEDATQAVFDRFDQITKMLLGETKKSKRSGEKPIAEMVRDKVIRDRALYLQATGPDEYPTGYYMDLAEVQLKEEGRIE